MPGSARAPQHRSIPQRPKSARSSADTLATASPSGVTAGTFLLRSSVLGHRTHVEPAAATRSDASRAQSGGYASGSPRADDASRSPQHAVSPDRGRDASPLVHLSLVVVGARAVGKSTFAQLASLTEAGHVDSGPASFALDGLLCKTKFDQVDLHRTALAQDERVQWDVEWSKLAEADGAVLLYNVMDPTSYEPVENLLYALAGLPKPNVILVATHCDFPPTARLVNPDLASKRAKEILPGLSAYKIALYAESRPRAIVQALLAEILARRSFGRSRDARLHYPPAASGPPFGANAATTSSPVPGAAFDARLHGRPRADPSHSFDINRLGPSALSPLGAASVHVRDRPGTGDSLPETAETVASRLLASRNRSPRTFLDLDDSPHDDEDGVEDDEAAEEETIPGIESKASRNIAKPDYPDFSKGGSTFEELVDRLLRPVPNKEDAAFQQTFLAFYRLFAPPSRLLNAIVSHFGVVTRNPVTPWDHDTKLDRDLAVLETWLAQYPGDFAKTPTRRRLQNFLACLVKNQGWSENDLEGVADFGNDSSNPNLGWDWTGSTAAAQQMSLALESVVEDDDTDWACADPGSGTRSRANTFLSISSIDSLDDTPSLPRVARSAISHLEHDTKLIFGGQSTVTLAAIGRSRVRSNTPMGSSTTLVSIAESAQRQALLLALTPLFPLDKPLWRSFISYSDEQIACELTRIDWILFSAIRPRDLIRNITMPVSSSSSGPRACPASENVTRMIDHFNHLAFWVTNLILLRDKAKHRSQMLEKLMRVASELRKLNNYNALGAFIAAIRGPSISRLSATRALVDGDVQKRFASLEVLMSTARGHWAYRFALENTEQETIPRLPFLPLHRRDLIVAESAGKTFFMESGDLPSASATNWLHSSSTATLAESMETHKASAPFPPASVSPLASTPTTPNLSMQPSATSRINWPKFAVMGETLAVLQRAQATPYTGFTPNDEIRNLLLRGRVCKDEDELYKRSVLLETGTYGDNNGVGGQRVRRKIQGGLEKLGRLKGLD